eukprot:363403-Chlamydomonas_euryale.AAC.25
MWGYAAALTLSATLALTAVLKPLGRCPQAAADWMPSVLLMSIARTSPQHSARRAAASGQPQAAPQTQLGVQSACVGWVGCVGWGVTLGLRVPSQPRRGKEKPSALAPPHLLFQRLVPTEKTQKPRRPALSAPRLRRPYPNGATATRSTQRRTAAQPRTQSQAIAAAAAAATTGEPATAVTAAAAAEAATAAAAAAAAAAEAAAEAEAAEAARTAAGGGGGGGDGDGDGSHARRRRAGRSGEGASCASAAGPRQLRRRRQRQSGEGAAPIPRPHMRDAHALPAHPCLTRTKVSADRMPAVHGGREPNPTNARVRLLAPPGPWA